MLAVLSGVCLGAGIGVVPAAAAPAAGAAVAAKAAVPKGLESFYNQTVEWYDCGATGGMEESADKTGFQCAKVTVPLDYSQPEGETIEIAMKKHVATGSVRQGSLFANPGGPGDSGVEMVERNEIEFSPDLNKSYDIIGFDPRGIGESTPITCAVAGETPAGGAAQGAMGAEDPLSGSIRPDAAGVDPEPPEDTEIPAAGVAAGGAGFKALIDEITKNYKQKEADCAASTKPAGLLDHVDTVSVARDLDVLRALSGNDKLNYLGLSYGTYLGAHYAELFPANTGRMVLDGALDPSLTYNERRQGQAQGFERALRNYVEWCHSEQAVQAGQSCPLTGDTDAGVQQIGDLFTSANKTPIPSSDPNRPVTGEDMKQIVELLLYAPESAWSGINEALDQAINHNDASMFRIAMDQVTAQPLVNMGAMTSTNCLDYRVEGDMATWKAQSEALGKIAPRFATTLEGGDLICQSWGHSGTKAPKALHAKGAAPILVAGTTGDPATPYEWSIALAGQLESGQLLTWEGNGHLAYGNPSHGPCVTNAVDNYLLTGTMPKKGLTCHGKE